MDFVQDAADSREPLNQEWSMYGLARNDALGGGDDLGWANDRLTPDLSLRPLALREDFAE